MAETNIEIVKELFKVAKQIDELNNQDYSMNMYNKALAYSVYSYVIEHYPLTDEAKQSELKVNLILNTNDKLEFFINAESVKEELEKIVSNPFDYDFNFSPKTKPYSTHKQFQQSSYKAPQKNTRTKYTPPISTEPAIFDPTNQVWLNILLYGSIVLEIIILIGLVVTAIKLESFLIFFGGVIALIFLHFILMVSLNKAFNIQSIKNDIIRIRREITSRQRK